MSNNNKTASKAKTRTALGLIFSVGLIAASSASQAALWGLFEEEKEPLKTEKRVPALNAQAGYSVAPDPNLVYGSMPTSPAAPIDYNGTSPMRPPMQSPSLPVALNAPATPEYIAAPSLTGQSQMSSQMAVPAMPPAEVTSNPLMAPTPARNPMPGIPAMPVMPSMPMQAPQPPEFGANGLPVTAPAPMGMAPAPMAMAPAPMAPQMPVQQFKSGVDSDGYPKLSAMSSAPIAQPPAVNQRAENLKSELANSKSMAGTSIDAPVKPALNPEPQVIAQPAPIAPAPIASSNEFMSVPPASFAPAPAQTASVTPVFPSGPSVTVRSKRAGAASFNTAPMQQQAFVPPAPVAPAPDFAQQITPAPISAETDIALASPTPLIDKAPMPSEPKTYGSAFAPSPVSAPNTAPVISKEKYVGESTMPMASAYDAPIDSNYNPYNYSPMGNAGLSNTSYTVGNSGRSARHVAMLPKSRYENYRKNSR